MADGKRGNWMEVTKSDRPQDVLKLTGDQEAKLKGVLGFTGRDQAGDVQVLNILIYKGSTAPTLTDFATTPIGTFLYTPEVADTFGFYHKAKSDPGVIGDWQKVVSAVAT